MFIDYGQDIICSVAQTQRVPRTRNSVHMSDGRTSRESLIGGKYKGRVGWREGHARQSGKLSSAARVGLAS